MEPINLKRKYCMNKFTKLNFNLKNIIFSYLEIEHSFNSIFSCHKSFIVSIKSRKIFGLFNSGILKNLIYKFNNIDDEFFKDFKLNCFIYFDSPQEFYIFSGRILNKLMWKNKKFMINLNRLKSTDSARILSECLLKNKYIIEIIIKGLSYGSENQFLKIIKNSIIFNTNIESIILINGPRIDRYPEDCYDTIHIINEIIINTPYLKKLQLPSIVINDDVNLIRLLKETIINKNLLDHLIIGGCLRIAADDIIPIIDIIKAFNNTEKILDLEIYFYFYNPLFLKMLSETLIEFNSSITSLNIKDGSIDLDNVKLLSEAIKQNKKIKKLDLSDSNLAHSIEAMRILKDALIINNSITSINFNNNKISQYPESMKIFKEIFSFNKRISKLIISLDEFKEHPSSLILFSELISESNLEEIDLSGEYVKFENVQIFNLLKDGFIKNKTIKKLDVSSYLNHNKLPDIDGICEIISNNESIEELILTGYDITNIEDIKKLSESIRINKSLKKLDVFNNAFFKNSDKNNYKNVFEIFAKGIMKNEKIDTLNLSYINLFENKNAILDLRKLIKKCKNIKILDLSDLELETLNEDIFEILLEIIIENDNLEVLKIDNFNIFSNPKYIRAFDEAINENKILKKLKVGMVDFGKIFISDRSKKLKKLIEDSFLESNNDIYRWILL